MWELLVRQRLVERTRLQPGRLHSEAVKYVSAKAQFQALARLEPLLTEQEQAVVRRGKNTSKGHRGQARHPGGIPCLHRVFEALLGLAVPAGRGERIREAVRDRLAGRARRKRNNSLRRIFPKNAAPAIGPVLSDRCCPIAGALLSLMRNLLVAGRSPCCGCSCRWCCRWSCWCCGYRWRVFAVGFLRVLAVLAGFLRIGAGLAIVHCCFSFAGGRSVRPV